MALPVTLWEEREKREREKSSSKSIQNGGQERREVTRHAGY